MSLKAVVFDVDGVLVFPWRFAQYLAHEHAITQEQTAGFFGGIFNACVIGEADLKEVLPPYLTLWNWPGTVDDFLQTWLETDNALDERFLPIVASLREAGIVCAVATNQEIYRSRYLHDTMGFETLFDKHFYSSAMGCRKPDPRFYITIECGLRLPPHEILFWDDTPPHVEAARKRGWRAELYTEFPAFEAAMKRAVSLQELPTPANTHKNGYPGT